MVGVIIMCQGNSLSVSIALYARNYPLESCLTELYLNGIFNKHSL